MKWREIIIVVMFILTFAEPIVFLWIMQMSNAQQKLQKKQIKKFLFYPPVTEEANDDAFDILVENGIKPNYLEDKNE